MPPPTTTTPLTISSLTYIRPQNLATLLLSSPSKVAIIDVRDADHIGGHIKGSSWIPTDQLDMRIPELLRLHSDKEKIVFHCMLSQQRGPASALKFARAAAAARRAAEGEGQRDGAVGGGEDAEKKEEKQQGVPEVCVLEGGFGMWQARYGEDERLTEAYVKDLWD